MDIGRASSVLSAIYFDDETFRHANEVNDVGANRLLPRIHGAFADIWSTEKLWVTIDRANLNVPNRSRFEFAGFIHWDIDTSVDPLPFDVQAVLSLTDNPPGQSGFQCVAGKCPND